MNRGDIDYCWKCHVYRAFPCRDCSSCGQVNAYSIAHEQRVARLRITYPGFHAHYLDAEGRYIERFCPNTGHLIIR